MRSIVHSLVKSASSTHVPIDTTTTRTTIAKIANPMDPANNAASRSTTPNMIPKTVMRFPRRFQHPTPLVALA